MEDRISEAVRDELRARGHTLQVNPAWTEGDVLGIRVDAAHDILRGGADLRGEQSKRMPSHVCAW